MLDRIDIHVEVPRVDYQLLSSDRWGESSEAIRERIEVARLKQRERFSNFRSSNVIFSIGASCAGVGNAGLMPARPTGGKVVLHAAQWMKRGKA